MQNESLTFNLHACDRLVKPLSQKTGNWKGPHLLRGGVDRGPENDRAVYQIQASSPRFRPGDGAGGSTRSASARVAVALGLVGVRLLMVGLKGFVE